MARHVKTIAAMVFVATTAIMLRSRDVSADVADSTGQFGSYTTNVGTKLANTDKGDVNLRLYAYFRYLNQNGLDPTYTDAFGNTTELQRRPCLRAGWAGRGRGRRAGRGRTRAGSSAAGRGAGESRGGRGPRPWRELRESERARRRLYFA